MLGFLRTVGGTIPLYLAPVIRGHLGRHPRRCHPLHRIRQAAADRSHRMARHEWLGQYHGRDLAAWLGLVPRQLTTGGRPRLMGISKRGNTYLRKLLIHGARAALPHVAERDTSLGRWVKGLLDRVHPNVAVVALANKLARISWEVLAQGNSLTPMGHPWPCSQQPGSKGC